MSVVSAVVALGLVPVVGEELVDSGGWVAVDASEHVLEVGKGLDPDGAAGLDEGEEDAGGVAACLAAREQPVLSSYVKLCITGIMPS
jgi:hypothetical protein